MTASEAVTGDRDWGRIRIDPDPDPDPVPDAMILKRLDSECPTATPATSTRITFCIVLFSDDFS